MLCARLTLKNNRIELIKFDILKRLDYSVCMKGLPWHTVVPGLTVYAVYTVYAKLNIFIQNNKNNFYFFISRIQKKSVKQINILQTDLAAAWCIKQSLFIMSRSVSMIISNVLCNRDVGNYEWIIPFCLFIITSIIALQWL